MVVGTLPSADVSSPFVIPFDSLPYIEEEQRLQEKLDKEKSLSGGSLHRVGSVQSGKDMAAHGGKKHGVDNFLNPRVLDALTPYRTVLGDVRQKLVNTRQRMADLLAGNTPNDDECYENPEDFAAPLLVLFR